MKKIGTLLKYFDAGRNNVFGRVLGIVQLLLTLGIYLKIDGEKFDIFSIIIFSIFLFVLILFSGWIYVSTGLFRSENQSRNYDNPEVMKILNNTEKILEKVNKNA